jgi:hypothetical protein
MQLSLCLGGLVLMACQLLEWYNIYWLWIYELWNQIWYHFGLTWNTRPLISLPLLLQRMLHWSLGYYCSGLGSNVYLKSQQCWLLISKPIWRLGCGPLGSMSWLLIYLSIYIAANNLIELTYKTIFVWQVVSLHIYKLLGLLKSNLMVWCVFLLDVIGRK